MPTCPECHKRMRAKQTLGLNYAISYFVEKVSSGGKTPTEYACVGMVANPKYPTYLKQKKEHDKQMQKYMQAVEANESRLIFKKKLPPKPAPLPPAQMPKVPCKNHWRYSEMSRSDGTKLIHRQKPIFFVVAGKDLVGNDILIKSPR